MLKPKITNSQAMSNWVYVKSSVVVRITPMYLRFSTLLSCRY